MERQRSKGGSGENLKELIENEGGGGGGGGDLFMNLFGS